MIPKFVLKWSKKQNWGQRGQAKEMVRNTTRKMILADFSCRTVYSATWDLRCVTSFNCHRNKIRSLFPSSNWSKGSGISGMFVASAHLEWAKDWEGEWKIFTRWIPGLLHLPLRSLELVSMSVWREWFSTSLPDKDESVFANGFSISMQDFQVFSRWLAALYTV